MEAQVSDALERVEAALAERDAKHPHPDYDRECVDGFNEQTPRWADLRALCAEIRALRHTVKYETDVAEQAISEVRALRADKARLEERCPADAVTEASGECAHDWVPMVGGEVCYGCNRIRRYDNVTYTAPEPIATPRPADAVTEAMRDLLASAIGQAVVSCAHFASRNIPTEAWNVDYAGIIARALAALGLTPEGK